MFISTRLILLLTIIAPFMGAFAQQLSYSPETVFNKDAYNILLPHRTGSTIHAWQVDRVKRPVLWQFDTSLRTIQHATHNIPVKSAGQVSTIVYTGFYYLYCRIPDNPKRPYALYRVSDDGTVENVTTALQKVQPDSLLESAHFFIARAGQKLFCFSVLAMPDARKGIIDLKIADSLLSSHSSQQVAFNLDPQKESIQRIQFANDSTLYIVVGAGGRRVFGELTVYQINLRTMTSRSVVYANDRFLFTNPALYADPAGNGIWLFATTMQPDKNATLPGAVKMYMVRLNDSLTEMGPVKLVNINASSKSDLRQTRKAAYIPFKMHPSAQNGMILMSAYLEDNHSPVKTIVGYQPARYMSYGTMIDERQIYGNSPQLETRFGNRGVNLTQIPGDPVAGTIEAMRITWINHATNVVNDKVLMNGTDHTDILFQNGLIAEEPGRLKILYAVKIKRRRNSIMRYTIDESGLNDYLMITNPRYEHFLNRSIKLDERTYIFPYRKGGRMGLAKVRF